MIINGYKIEPYANLNYANLYSANLLGSDLRGADLTGANLRVANLRGVDLTCADLRGADLTCADLRDANLCGADLSKTGLRIHQADFYTAYIMPDMIRIGCQYHTKEKWATFTDDEISLMSPRALEWWTENKRFVLAD